MKNKWILILITLVVVLGLLYVTDAIWLIPLVLVMVVCVFGVYKILCAKTISKNNTNLYNQQMGMRQAGFQNGMYGFTGMQGNMYGQPMVQRKAGLWDFLNARSQQKYQQKMAQQNQQYLNQQYLNQRVAQQIGGQYPNQQAVQQYSTQQTTQQELNQDDGSGLVLKVPGTGEDTTIQDLEQVIQALESFDDQFVRGLAEVIQRGKFLIMGPIKSMFPSIQVPSQIRPVSESPDVRARIIGIVSEQSTGLPVDRVFMKCVLKAPDSIQATELAKRVQQLLAEFEYAMYVNLSITPNNLPYNPREINRELSETIKTLKFKGKVLTDSFKERVSGCNKHVSTYPKEAVSHILSYYTRDVLATMIEYEKILKGYKIEVANAPEYITSDSGEMQHIEAENVQMTEKTSRTITNGIKQKASGTVQNIKQGVNNVAQDVKERITEAVTQETDEVQGANIDAAQAELDRLQEQTATMLTEEVPEQSEA